MSYTKDELVNYRLSQAWETFEEAKLLAKHEHWNTTVNRLYYACFHMISALLAENELKARTHAGVKVLLHQHFVKKDIVSKKSAEFFSSIFDKRQEGDYEDFVSFVRETVSPLIKKTELFLNELKSKF